MEEVPVPQVKFGHVLIQTTRTLVSLVTERMLVEFGKANLIDKARQQPDKVKQVLDKIKTDGLQPTLEAVFNKLGQPLPLGYCNVGRVVAVGKGVAEFKVGDRVASNGNHAEFVCVPKNLVAKVPDDITDEEAAFTVIGSIGLQGIRLLNPQLGETVVVIGLGLIGLVAAQLLKANGRYDEEYENNGHDYPLAYVRWTEKRNFETILHAISSGSLDVRPLITEEVDLADYEEIYGDMRKKGSIASIVRFPVDSKMESVVSIGNNAFVSGKGKIGIIGAGNYTSAMIIPCLAKAHARIKYIASAQGLSAKILARRAGAENATSDYQNILRDPEVDLVMVTTRHNLHARMVIEALRNGKSVFVEKPLCLNETELDDIIQAYQEAPEGTTLTVGFNRRFSPFAEKMRRLLGDGPKNIVATMNAGFIPREVWVHDLEIGGGRIIGEACHFIDLCSFLAGSEVVAVCMNALGENPEENTDNASILLRYANGTNAVINYFANGSKSYAKERVEVFSQERVLVLDNWRKLTGYGFKGFSSMKAGMDKGQKRQFTLLNERIREGGKPLIPFGSILNTTKATFACITSLKERCWVNL